MTSILLVACDHADRANARRHLERAGYNVQTAKSNPEAMLAARLHRFDLIVCDEREGLDLCKRLRGNARSGTVPVVLVSDRMLSESDRDRAYNLGALELIERSDDYARELTWIRVAVQQVQSKS